MGLVLYSTVILNKILLKTSLNTLGVEVVYEI